MHSKTYEKALAGEYQAHRPFAGDMKEWEKQQKEMRHRLRHDLEAEFDLTDHPRRDTLWEAAKQCAHSTEAARIAECYADLVPLLMPTPYRAWKHLQKCLDELAFLDDQDHKPENPSKMYKLHLALAGQLPGYRADIDAALAIMEGLKTKEPNGTPEGQPPGTAA